MKITNQKNANKVVVAQFSDCHLFADINQTHHGANVYQHLTQVLVDISANKSVDVIVFTGDLTQDHSVASYQNFVNAVKNSAIKSPVFYLAGNHDDAELLAKSLQTTPFNPEKSIEIGHWQIQLLNSKSASPAGYVSQMQIQQINSVIKPAKYQLLMMHHHPVNVGYFIDRHGLTNQDEFWQTLNAFNQQHQQIKAVACGHVHGAMYLAKHSQHSEQSLDVYTCPATSIAFDPSKNTVGSLGLPPSYRLFSLFDDGKITSEVVAVHC